MPYDIQGGSGEWRRDVSFWSSCFRSRKRMEEKLLDLKVRSPVLSVQRRHFLLTSLAMKNIQTTGCKSRRALITHFPTMRDAGSGVMEYGK